ncbi:MAG: DUF433 domain-containing protein [Bryobacterales bacterium]|nr:DUF433 domain-containing protein [Bryobacterales bacterium]
MAVVTEIGSLISRDPEIRGGRPCIAGTGVSVRRIAVWHNMGPHPRRDCKQLRPSVACAGACRVGLLLRQQS